MTVCALETVLFQRVAMLRTVQKRTALGPAGLPTAHRGTQDVHPRGSVDFLGWSLLLQFMSPSRNAPRPSPGPEGLPCTGVPGTWYSTGLPSFPA